MDHITFVSRQLVSSLKQLSDSPRVKSSHLRSSSEAGLPPLELQQLLQDTVHLSTLLARVGGCAENYGQLRGTNIVPPAVVFLQCLLNLVSGGLLLKLCTLPHVGGKNREGKGAVVSCTGTITINFCQFNLLLYSDVAMVGYVIG